MNKGNPLSLVTAKETSMNLRIPAIAFFMLVLLPGPSPVLSQPHFDLGIRETGMEILSPENFESMFGGNPDIPRTDEEVLALALRLYPPLAVKAAQTPPPDIESRPPPTELEPGAAPHLPPRPRCGTLELEALFAALQNPAISDATREAVDEIIAGSKPPFKPPHETAHFHIYYTDNNSDPQHNVTLSQAKATGTALEKYYLKYAASFTAPKGPLPIKVQIYYISDTVAGRTTSNSNLIELNSSEIRNICSRRGTSAHELFHRVQYRYGYVSGTPLIGWAVEGTASWSEKFACRPEGVWSYTDDMNDGLLKPDVNLLRGRKYDASHLWVYLHERSKSSPLVIRDFWAQYQKSHNGPAALNTVTKNWLGFGFDTFIRRWHLSNFLKDLGGVAPSYDYQEDETTIDSPCGFTWGPLAHVPKTAARSITSKSKEDILRNVAPYGADYWVFTIDPKLTRLRIRVKGIEEGDFSYQFVRLKDNKVGSITTSTTNDYTFNQLLTPGQIDKLILVVSGRAHGGAYTVSLRPTDIQYKVTYSMKFNLTTAWTDQFDTDFSLGITGNASGYIPEFTMTETGGYHSDQVFYRYLWVRNRIYTMSSGSWDRVVDTVTMLGDPDNWWGVSCTKKETRYACSLGHYIDLARWDSVETDSLGGHYEKHTTGPWPATETCSFSIDAAKVGTSFVQPIVFYDRLWEHEGETVVVGRGTLTFQLIDE